MRVHPRICAFLARRLAPRRKPDRHIGGEADPYMLRWHLWPRNRWCNGYLHVMLRSDEDRACHDHPWRSVSLLLRGPLYEVVRAEDGAETVRLHQTGALVYRSATFAHRLVVLPGQPTMTIFLTGRRVRSWGFWCPKGWRHWREFVSPSDSNIIGPGCD